MSGWSLLEISSTKSILKQIRRGEVKLADWLTGGYSNEFVFYSLHGLSMKVRIVN